MYFIITYDIETSTRHYIPGDLLNMKEMSALYLKNRGYTVEQAVSLLLR